MTISYYPILSLGKLVSLFNLAKLDRAVEAACQLAIKHPQALYLLMQRYTHFNECTGSLVAQLASSIGLSRQSFTSSSNLVADEATWELKIAAKALSATIDERSDKSARFAHHRTLAQAILKSIGNYAELTLDQQNQFSLLPDWMQEILDNTIQGYQSTPGDAVALIRTIGFHAASEFLAAREYSIIDRVIRYDNRNTGFDAYLRRIHGKAEIEQDQFSAWYWIVVYGQYHGSGVEVEHFKSALEALNLATHYRPESAQQIQQWALDGFSEFVAIQQKLFKEISQECFNLLQQFELLSSTAS